MFIGIQLRPSMLTTVAVIGLMSSFTPTAHSQEPLRWKFEVGEKFEYDTTQDMTLTMKGGPLPQGIVTNVEQQMDMTWDVEGVKEDGEAVIRQKIDRVRMKMKGPMGNVDYDSNSEEPPAGMAAMWAPMFDAMTQGDFEITMTSRGEIRDVKVPEELLEALKNSPGAQGMGAMNAEGFKKMLAQGALVLPADAPNEGESWTTTIEVNNPTPGKVETKYTYDGTKEIEGAKYAVFKPELKMSFAGNADLQMKVKDQKSEGEVLFNVDEGRLSSSTLKQNVTMDVMVGGATLEQKIDQTIEVEVKPAGEEGDTSAKEPQEDEAASEN